MASAGEEEGVFETVGAASNTEASSAERCPGSWDEHVTVMG